MILANHGVISSSGGSFDADALSFITAASITDNTQKTAVNTLVTDLKAYNIWTKMKALYPFVGGNATSHKFNLKDPRDLDVAFRLVFFGGGSHSSNGYVPNLTSYADTKLNPFNELNLNSCHFSYYSRTNTSKDKYDMGVTTNTGETLALVSALKWTDGNLYYGMSFNEIGKSSSSSSKSFIFNKTSSTSTALFENTTKTSNTIITKSALPNANFFIAARNLNGVAENSSERNCAFASIGDGLTDTDASNFYTAVQNFNTTLNRQV